MKTSRLILPTLAIFVLFATSVPAQTTSDAKLAAVHPAKARPKVCSACIRAHEEFLASDAMQGRGSGTHDELVTATYIASQLRQYGIDPAGDDGEYIQRASTIRREITAPPEVELIPPNGSASAEAVHWLYGKE